MKALVLPVENPSDALLALVHALPPDEFAAIVVVDDGSPATSSAAAIHAEMRARGVIVVRHAVRVGRGAALRAGMHAALAQVSRLDSIVFAGEEDSADEIARVSARSGAVVLGTRAAVPGTRGVMPGTRAVTLGTRDARGRDWPMRVLAGIRVSDPWARLRSIPAALFPRLLTLESNGDAFDVETLVAAAEQSIPIVEERIESRGVRPHAGRTAAVRPLLRFLARSRPDRAITRLLAALVLAVFAATLAASVNAFATGHLFRQFIWLPWGLRRLVHFGALLAACSVPVLLMFPWAYAALFAALLAGATTLAEGPLAVAAVLLFLVASNALGTAAARRMPGKRHTPAAEILHTLLGIGIYAFAMTLSARLPVNYPIVWGVLLVLPIALDFRGVAQRARGWLAALGSVELRNWRERGALVLLLFVLSIHWLGALEPEYSADGLTMHLAIAADIAAHHAMTFHPNLFVWSVMPMAADFANTIVYLIGGEASASLLNFALLVAIAGLLYRAVRRWLPRDAALLTAALFASTPLVNLVTGSLFIENFIAAMILGMAIELWRFHESGEARDLWIAAALGGTAASAKLGACAFVLVGLAVAAAEARRRRILKPALQAAGLLLLFAAPPYAIAYALTGNPVFPFLNWRFPSPLLEHGVEFRNNLFTQPLNWKTPFELTFHTSQYLEGLNGAVGFQYLLLIPLAVIALFAARNYGVRLAAAIGLFAGAAVMASQPYARYLYPALPLLTIPFASLAARFAPRQRKLYYALFAAVLVCIALNVYFTPVSGWYHKDLYAPAIFRRDGRARVIHADVPLRDVTMRFREMRPNDHVLLLVEEDLADAGSSAYEYHWHQHSISTQIGNAASVSTLRDLFLRLGIRYFISRRPGPDDDLLSPPALAEFLASCAAPMVENGRFYAAQITSECDGLSGAALVAKLEGLPPALVSPGSYDDFDPSLRFRGVWTRSHGFTGPYRHTVSYTDAPGASVAFAFEGSSLTYLYTKAANRGIAILEIDGVPHEIDLYAPEPEWQSRLEFCCLSPGAHLAVLRATGRKRVVAQDVYIDVDAFIARRAE